jgi:hypothetical protein
MRFRALPGLALPMLLAMLLDLSRLDKMIIQLHNLDRKSGPQLPPLADPATDLSQQRTTVW